MSGFDVIDPNARLTSYAIEQQFPDPVRTVRIWNEFGEQELYLGRAMHLLVPARETGGDGSAAIERELGAEGGEAGANGGEAGRLEHFKCFIVLRSCCVGPHRITVTDPDGVDRSVAVTTPRLFCVPVSKKRDGAEAVEEVSTHRNHLVMYAITRRDRVVETKVTDQFGANGVTLRTGVHLGVPSLLLKSFPPLPSRPSVEAAEGEQSVSTGDPAANRGVLSLGGR